MEVSKMSKRGSITRDNIEEFTAKDILKHLELAYGDMSLVEISLKNKRKIVKNALLVIERDYAKELDYRKGEFPTDYTWDGTASENKFGERVPGGESLKQSPESQTVCIGDGKLQGFTNKAIISNASKRTLIEMAQDRFGKKVGGFFTSRRKVFKRVKALYEDDGWVVS